MATHSSILAWKIPWTEELGGLQSTGLKESDTTERLHFHKVYIWNLERWYCRIYLQGSSGETDIESRPKDMGDGRWRG